MTKSLRNHGWFFTGKRKTSSFWRCNFITQAKNMIFLITVITMTQNSFADSIILTLLILWWWASKKDLINQNIKHIWSFKISSLNPVKTKIFQKNGNFSKVYINVILTSSRWNHSWKCYHHSSIQPKVSQK